MDRGGGNLTGRLTTDERYNGAGKGLTSTRLSSYIVYLLSVEYNGFPIRVGVSLHTTPACWSRVGAAC